MPRKPVPCSGCGKPCHPSGSRYRAGVAPAVLCLECRRSRPGYHGKFAAKAELRLIACEICGRTAPATTNRDSGSKRQKTCGADECRKEVERRRYERYRATERGMQARAFASDRASCQVWHVNCAECGKLFVARRPRQVTCSGDCRYRRLINQVLDRHYGYVNNAMREGPLLEYLIKRDRRRCGICRKPVRAKTGPMRPSIDHIIPRSRGGSDDLANLHLAHLRCNQSKNNGGSGEQLLLVG